jgi:hypothetical protein
MDFWGPDDPGVGNADQGILGGMASAMAHSAR